MASKGPRKANGGFDLSQSPSHLLRRCVQYANDLFSREPGASDLTKQQFTVLTAVEQNEGMSQTDLVAITGIDRSTLAEMIRRMIEKGLLDRERTESDQRANAVRIAASGKKALRGARTASERVERTFALEPSRHGPGEILENAVRGRSPGRNRKSEHAQRHPRESTASALIQTLISSCIPGRKTMPGGAVCLRSSPAEGFAKSSGSNWVCCTCALADSGRWA